LLKNLVERGDLDDQQAVSRWNNIKMYQSKTICGGVNWTEVSEGSTPGGVLR
jgi:hypothetical protein